MTLLCLSLVFFCYLLFRSLVSVQYMQGQKDLLSGVWNSGSTLKCMLVNSYTPSVTSDKHYSDISTEVTGSGYTAGGNTLTSVTVTETAANSWGTTWAASTAYSLNSLVIPASANTYVYCASVAGTSAANVTPTAGTNASPIVVTATGHGYQTGNSITISGVTGNTNMNGTWIVVVLSANTYNLMNPGTFGGTVTVAPAWPTVRGETITDGTVEWTCAGQSVVSFSCANPTWTSATITATGAIIYYSSGTGSTSTLIAYLDFGGSVSSTAGTFTVTIPSNGVYYETP